MQLFVDNLTNVDFSYLCPQRGLVGETWLVQVSLSGEPDDEGMILDFGVVKRQVRDWLSEHLDHKLLIPVRAPQLRSFQAQEGVGYALEGAFGTVECRAPAVAFAGVDAAAIDPAAAAEWARAALQEALPAGAVLRLEFITEAIDGPFYHYSHGLKKHRGQCQRIAHGHRSKLEIWRDGKLWMDAMQSWAHRLQDSYFGTEQDICERSERHIAFSYRAQEGQFYLRLPSTSCEILPCDTTVENIASHIHRKLSSGADGTGREIVVKAYEGLNKGAIVG